MVWLGLGEETMCVCSLNSGMDMFLHRLREWEWASGGAESVGCWSQLPEPHSADYFPTEFSGTSWEA